MTEYLLKIKKTKNTKSLLNYLQSLDFVSLIPKKANDTTTKEKPGVIVAKKVKKSFSDFLNNLPEVEYQEDDVLAEIKKMRNEA